MPAVLRLAWCLLLSACFLPASGARAGLPAEVEAALARSRLPLQAISLLVVDASTGALPRLSHRADAPMNPASVAKLITTYAALDLLGPAYRWTTPVYLDGTIQDGTLQGNLYIKGQGDPSLVMERLWLLLRRVRGLGIERIAGDIVLDRSAFALPPHDPAAFDGEPLRPYNAAPDALLVNFRSVQFHFTPLAEAAQVQMEPPLAGVRWPARVPLTPGHCADWRSTLQADFSDPGQVRFSGAYPAGCGPRSWPIAPPDAAGHAARVIAGLWRELGGALLGQVREGRVPPGLQAVVRTESPPLAEIVRDINKFSNNVMAQQLFLTLSLQQQGVGTWEGSRELLRQWWRERLGTPPPDFIGNGSGLSRDDRVSAAQLVQLLRHAWASPLMPEFIASLPVAGLDGTARRIGARTAGSAHLKTGSLRDVTAVAGYVHAPQGERRMLVAIANHPDAAALRPVIDALIAWATRTP